MSLTKCTIHTAGKCTMLYVNVLQTGKLSVSSWRCPKIFLQTAGWLGDCSTNRIREQRNYILYSWPPASVDQEWRWPTSDNTV